MVGAVACLALLTACGGSTAGSAGQTSPSVGSTDVSPTRATASPSGTLPDFRSLEELWSAIDTPCTWTQKVNPEADFAVCAKPPIVAMVLHGGGEPMTPSWIATSRATPEDECFLWDFMRIQRRLAAEAVSGTTVPRPEPAGVVIGLRWLVFYEDAALGAAMGTSSGGYVLTAPTGCPSSIA